MGERSSSEERKEGTGDLLKTLKEGLGVGGEKGRVTGTYDQLLKWEGSPF